MVTEDQRGKQGEFSIGMAVSIWISQG
uniref:Uncharacterized protein n=1 Tax=Moniliophthora roreri TaxID=221103 RepID=A0A0W0FX07_MONRR